MMNRIELLTHLVVVSMMTFLFLSQAHGQVRSLTVAVDGMACPFCAYGVEKKLKKVVRVESITIRMKEGTATLSAKEGESINVSQVSEAIRESGFTPGIIKITAIGTTKVDKEQQMLLQLS